MLCIQGHPPFIVPLMIFKLFCIDEQKHEIAFIIAHFFCFCRDVSLSSGIVILAAGLCSADRSLDSIVPLTDCDLIFCVLQNM